MPWEIKKRGDEWCVHKKGSSSPVPGGCHASRAKAVRHQRALYASESTEAVTMNSEIATNATGTFDITVANNHYVRALKNADGEVVGFMTDSTPAPIEETGPRTFEGVLGVIGHPTSDKRYLMPDEITERELPLPFNVQIKTDEGHDSSENAGRIEELLYVPASEFDKEEYPRLKDVPDEATVIWGRGVLDDSSCADEAERLITNGYGVSLDLPHDRLAIIDPDTFEEVAEEDANMADVLAGRYLTGIGGKIAGATVVNVPAFEEASVKLVEGHALVASAFGMRVWKTLDNESLVGHVSGLEGPPDYALTASAAPLKPPREWFEDPGLQKLTPLTITKEGRIFGHLADWDGCHTGFSSVCVPPFRSETNYAYFNTGELECDDGSLVAVGKLMFDMDGGKHAPTHLDWAAASRHYDDSTKVGGFVRAGTDRFGTYLAGATRPTLTEEEIQHLRSHPPSGDWRPIPGKGSELVAAFAVAVGGFPIPRAMIASAENGELTIISAPLDMEMGPRQSMRKRQVLRARLRDALSR